MGSKGIALDALIECLVRSKCGMALVRAHRLEFRDVVTHLLGAISALDVCSTICSSSVIKGGSRKKMQNDVKIYVRAEFELSSYASGEVIAYDDHTLHVSCLPKVILHFLQLAINDSQAHRRATDAPRSTGKSWFTADGGPRDTSSTDRRVEASQLPQLWRVARCHRVPSAWGA